MVDNLVVSSLEEVMILIHILLVNNKQVTQISLTINGDYDIWWDDVFADFSWDDVKNE